MPNAGLRLRVSGLCVDLAAPFEPQHCDAICDAWFLVELSVLDRLVGTRKYLELDVWRHQLLSRADEGADWQSRQCQRALSLQIIFYAFAQAPKAVHALVQCLGILDSPTHANDEVIL